MTRSIVACVEDLFFRSKIEATARHLNVPLRFCDPKDLAQAVAPADTAAVLVEIADNDAAIDAVARLRKNAATKKLPVIGFLKHTDRDLALRANEAGFTNVLPRSQFSETLPDLLMDLLAPGTKREMQEEVELPDE